MDARALFARTHLDGRARRDIRIDVVVRRFLADLCEDLMELLVVWNRIEPLEQGIDLACRLRGSVEGLDRCIAERPALTGFAPGRAKSCHLKGFDSSGAVIR